MKIIFIYLGILVTMFGNAICAYDLSNKQNYQEINSSVMSFVSLSNGTKLKKPALALESGIIKTMIANDIKTMEEVIAEDNKIIESKIKSNPTSEMESTIEEVIKQDNQIIESNLTNEVFSLDFDSINRE